MGEPLATQRGVAVREFRPLGQLRRIMAKSMMESAQRSALSQVTREMDLSTVYALRLTAGEQRYSVNTYVLAAVAQTLPNHPLLNAELVDDQVAVFAAVNLGMAVAVADGLVVAVLRDADKKPLDELGSAAADLSARARSGKLRMADIEGGTFTVSNLGMYGIDGGFPLPRPPEGAILLVGRVRPQPAWRDGALVERQMAWCSLTFDHRFIDGAAAAAFLQELQQRLDAFA